MIKNLLCLVPSHWCTDSVATDLHLSSSLWTRGTSTPPSCVSCIFLEPASTGYFAHRLAQTLTILTSLQSSVTKTLWQPTRSPFLISPLCVTPTSQALNCSESSELFISLLHRVWQIPPINCRQPSLTKRQRSHWRVSKLCIMLANNLSFYHCSANIHTHTWTFPINVYSICTTLQSTLSIGQHNWGQNRRKKMKINIVILITIIIILIF